MALHDCTERDAIRDNGEAIATVSANVGSLVEQVRMLAGLVERMTTGEVEIRHLRDEQKTQWRRIDQMQGEIKLNSELLRDTAHELKAVAEIANKARTVGADALSVARNLESKPGKIALEWLGRIALITVTAAITLWVRG